MASTEPGIRPSPLRPEEDPQAVLARRARELARLPARADSNAKRLRLVELSIANERYGVESWLVREVTQLRRVTAVPCTPPYVLGIINVRGRIFSVLDPRVLLELPFQDHPLSPRAVILHRGRMELGLSVDDVLGVRELDPADLQPNPAMEGGARSQYLKGITSDRLVILDAERILTDSRLIVHEQVDGEQTEQGSELSSTGW